MIVAVGSTNPVKLTAVRSVFNRQWPHCTFKSVAVPSGISEMPLSDDETRLGAYNRALAARERLNADFGVGLEGGVHPEPFGLVLQGWVVIVDRHGRTGIGGAPRLHLPDAIARRVLAGEELGPIMDELLGTENIKQKEGAVGALTNNLMVRGEAFTSAVAYALAPFVTPHFYSKKMQT